MYNRTRTYANYFPQATTIDVNSVIHRTAVDPATCTPLEDDIAMNPTETVYPMTYEVGTIEDLVYNPQKHSRMRKRKFNALPRPVKPCHHVYKKLQDQSDTVSFIHSKDVSVGTCIDTFTKTATTIPLAWLSERIGAGSVKDFLLDTIPSDCSGHTFTGVDWFALMSEFNEACDSLIPSSFFSGETFMEGGIFIDAAKLVLSPRKFVSGLFKNIAKRKLKHLNARQINLHYMHLLTKKGKYNTDHARELANDMGISASFVKEGINAHLLYKFGVEPAISDIGKTYQAHGKVDERLFYLNQHRGQYVPIRVRKDITYPTIDYVSNPNDPILFYDAVLRDKKSEFCIFGMGRVRTDINEASKWRAYTEYFGLNKIVGTAWELIPFTFVIDWFTNAQERLNDLTRIRLGEGPFMNLVSIGSSVKHKLSFDIMLYPGYDLTYGMELKEPNSPFPLASVDVVDYTRSPFIPDTSGVIDMSTLGLFHGVTAGELLLQKFL